MSEALAVPMSPARPRMTLDQFMTWNDGTDTRYELLDGEAYAMTPPLRAHGKLVAKAIILLGSRIPRHCHIITECGILPPDRPDSYFQADIVVTCTPGRHGDRWVDEPRIIVEVLSPSTETFDFTTKNESYRLFPSLRNIVYVWADRPKVGVWKCLDTTWMVSTHQGPDASFELDGMEGRFSVAELYEGVML